VRPAAELSGLFVVGALALLLGLSAAIGDVGVASAVAGIGVGWLWGRLTAPRPRPGPGDLSELEKVMGRVLQRTDATFLEELERKMGSSDDWIPPLGGPDPGADA